MRRLVAAFFICICTSAWPQESNLDWRMIQKEWNLIKEQLGAPADLPMPKIVVDSDNIPKQARMMFQYPIEGGDEIAMMILINPNTLVEYDREMVSWGVGHELTHYAMILEENNWDTQRKYYTQNIKHHCNRKFMRITKEIADLITSIYHDERDKYRMYHQVQRSCVDQPNQ